MVEKVTIISLFDKAATHLKFPHIKWKVRGDLYEFKRAGALARVPGVVHILLNCDYIGTINRKNELKLRGGNIPVSVDIDIAEFMSDPVKYAVISGKEFCSCCFCGISLTNASSVYHGYGPICADKWGLPWGDLPEKIVDLDIEEELQQSVVPEEEKISVNFIQLPRFLS